MTIAEKDLPVFSWNVTEFHTPKNVNFLKDWMEAIKSKSNQYKCNLVAYQLSSKQMRLNKRKLKKAIQKKLVQPVVSLERAFPVAIDIAPTDDTTVTLTATFKPE